LARLRLEFRKSCRPSSRTSSCGAFSLSRRDQRRRCSRNCGESRLRFRHPLREIINGLARLGVFLERTNHLSDRALYELLHDELLPDEMDELRTDDGAVWHLDILGGWSEQDVKLYLQYYADEEQRRAWLADWPDDNMPPHEDPPHDRDRLLPARDW
jgi:hypothetical protein